MKQLVELKDKLQSLDKKTRYYALAGILASILLVIVLFITFPLIGSISKLGANISTFRQNLEQLKNNKLRLEQFRQQQIDISKRINDIKNLVRPESEVPQVLKNISQLSNKYEVKIDQLTPLKLTKRLLLENEDGQYYALSISIKGQASYHALGKFIDAMEREHMFLDIQQLNITAKANDRFHHDIAIVIDIAVLGGAL